VVKRKADRGWKLAEEFGWAKTYDAEYVALAKLNNCRLVTVDGRLRRGANRLGLGANRPPVRQSYQCATKITGYGRRQSDSIPH
jgi:hypothetical protein